MILNKKDVSGFLDGLLAKYEVFAPVAENGNVNFKQIGSGSEAMLTYSNTVQPPKRIFFPQCEKLFSYRPHPGGVELAEHLDEGKKIVFGIRPCDAKSLSLLDRVFNNDKYQDTYYWKRRENTVLVGVGCNNPAVTCFCDSLGGAPFDPEGLDLLLIDIGESYLVQTVTEKGKELVAGLNLPEASPAELARAEQIKADVSLASRVNIDGLKQKLDQMFYHPVWDLLSEQCLGCAACSYLCPTCHCFDITDEAVDDSGCRVRNWDSCMFPLFTLHGSGHNPRTSGKERWRQRLMHKFKYFVDNFNAEACVGCGRCIKSCPVNLDIRSLVAVVQGQDIGERG